MAATAVRASTLSRESNVRLVDMDCSLPCRHCCSTGQTFRGSSRFHYRRVGFLEDDALQGRSPFPPDTLKFRFVTEVIHIPHAEVGYGLNMGGDAEFGTKSVRRKDADPANTDTLSTCGEP